MLMTTKHTRLKAMPFVLAVCLLLPAVVDPAAPAPLPSALEPLDFDRGASGLGLALRRVGTTARVLYVTAHPDDEHNGILVRLSRGLGLRTALLTESPTISLKDALANLGVVMRELQVDDPGVLRDVDVRSDLP